MSLHTLFSPKSIAVVGASTRPGSVGNDVAKNLAQSDFAGTLYFVNPKGGELFGKPCYATLADLPSTVELVIIIVPAAIVPQVLREAGEHMARAAVIISAGFRETGEAGRELEQEVIRIAEEYHLELLGPNCLGFIRPHLFLNASFASTLPVDGPIAFFSQSGALTSAFLDLSKGELGFSTFASIGNKATISEATLLSHFGDDEASKVIGFYTEGLEHAPELIMLGQRLLEKGKPVIALKSGTTVAGTEASSSHTGAVAGSDAAYSALFRQARIIRAQNFQDLLDLLGAFAHNPRPRGNRVAIVTNAGGLGVLATDACVKHGLELARLSETTVTALKELLPPAANSHNPIDVLGDALADRYASTLQIVAADSSVDLLLVILTPQTMTQDRETAMAITELRQKNPELPIITVFSGKQLVAKGIATLQQANIPNYLSPERAARALGALAQVSRWKTKSIQPLPLPPLTEPDTHEEISLLQTAHDQSLTDINEVLTTSFLKTYHLPFLESAVVTTPEEAQSFATALGRPIALKIASPDIIHKSDVGGVLVNIEPTNAATAFDTLMATVRQRAPQAKIDGALAVAMAEPGGIELLLGLKQEPGLGTLVVLGLGGIYVEVFRDISMRFAPLSGNDIDEMIDELQCAPLLQGARGQKPIDLVRLREYLARLSQIAINHPDIVELDINPLLVYPEADRFRIVDARMRIKK